MSESEDLRSFLRSMMEARMKETAEEEEREWVDVEKLTDPEIERYREIGARAVSVNKRFLTLQAEREIVEYELKVWWMKTSMSHKLMGKGALHITDDYVIQKEADKTKD